MTIQSDIQKIYIAYFNRPADSGGLAYWEQQISSGKASLTNLTDLFATTDEYKTLFSGSSPTQAVTTIYKNLFGREPEAAGLAYWTDALQKGQAQIGNVAYQALNGAQLADKLTIDNKAAAAAELTALLKSFGVDAAYAGTALQTAKAWLATVGDSATSLAAAQAQITSVISQFTKSIKFTLPFNPPPAEGDVVASFGSAESRDAASSAPDAAGHDALSPSAGTDAAMSVVGVAWNGVGDVALFG